MKLSFVFELLLIFILIAFAASAVIDSRALKKGNDLKKHNNSQKKRQESTMNKYCSCSSKLCNCCREFNIPVVALQGPGCASLQYLKGDRLALSMSFGERVLTNTTISSKKPQPVCMPLPGGVSKFCGRVYNIGRKGEDFNACLGLELRALENVEAALRVSCFRFGPSGLRVEPSQPLPPIEEEDDDDDEDEDDDFDFDDDYDDDDDDDDDDDEEEEEDDTDNDVDSVDDYTSFSVFDDDFIDEYFQSESSDNKKKTTKKPVVVVTSSTTPIPLRVNIRKPVQKIAKPLLKRKVEKTTLKTPLKLTSSTTMKVYTKAPIKKFTQLNDNKIISKIPITSEKPSLSLQTESVALENNSSVMSQIYDVKSQLTSISTPVHITAAVETTSVMPETPNIITEQSIIPLTDEPILHESQPKHETTTNTDKFTETTTMTQINNTTEEDEEEEDEDPLAEVVEEVLDDEDSTEIDNTTRILTNSTNEQQNLTNVEGKDVVDDIIDGMADTLGGEDDSEESSKKPDNDASEDEDEDDEDDEDDETDDLARKSRLNFMRRKVKDRQSRDMWLARLHW